MPNIVVLGSINMDLVVRCAQLPKPGETIIANESLEIPGGKGANQAVSAARAGGKVSMIGRVGNDAFAGRLRENLRNEKIDTSCVFETSDCASGIAVVAVESGGENAIMVVPGANGCVSPADVRAASDVIRHGDVLLIQLEIPLDAVSAATEIAAASGVPVILDPAPMPASVPSSVLNVDYICPNQSEASALVGSTIATVDSACRAVGVLHQKGPKHVIITLGGQGAVASDGDSIRVIDAFPITPLDTTAAGDAFAGAFAVRLAEGGSLDDSVRIAAAAGAIAATRLGAQVGMPTREEIERLL